MARFVSLTAAAALVLAGCSSEGKVGPPGTDGQPAVVSVVQTYSDGFATIPPASGDFWGPTLTASVAAGQRAQLTYSLGVIANSPQQSADFYLCYRVAGSGATPTPFPNARSTVFYVPWIPASTWYVESKAVHVNILSVAADDTYEFGLCGSNPTASIGWEGAEGLLMVLN
jgi:hypothetical protein